MSAGIPRGVLSLLHALAYGGKCTWWVACNPRSVLTRKGFLLVWGKIRRTAIVCVPGLAQRLQRKHGLTGQCKQCGASCNLLMPCPQWDSTTHLCRIYENRPAVCRHFPMTPADVRDVELSTGAARCGHSFKLLEQPVRLPRRQA